MKKRFKAIADKFMSLRTGQKIECILALVLSLFLIVGIPAYAWFANSHVMETLTKVKAPPTLDIRAGRAQAIKNFELRDIDITKVESGKCYVFCVKSGNENSTYKIQLAHTTNIPFNYKLYKATEVEEGQQYDVDYVLEGDGTEHAYYKKVGEEISMRELNPEDNADETRHGRNLAKYDANDKYYKLAYGDADGNPEIYAVAKYSQSGLIEARSAEYDYFILELSWAGSEGDTTEFKKWNKNENNKETDIIYISASKVNET